MDKIIKINAQEEQQLIALLDIAVKAVGLQAAQAALDILNKLNEVKNNG